MNTWSSCQHQSSIHSCNVPDPAAGLCKTWFSISTYCFLVQGDAYWCHGGLLSRAESAKESLERMLAVIRLILTLLTDILKPSSDPNDAPFHFLGSHYLSHRNLGDTSSCSKFAHESVMYECCGGHATRCVTAARWRKYSNPKGVSDSVVHRQ